MMSQKSQQYDASVTAKRAALKEAFRRAEQIELESIPDAEDIEWEFSPRFEQKMEQLIREQRRGRASRVFHMAGAKVAAACAAVCLITVCLLSVSAVKEPVENLLMTPHDNDSYITMKAEYDLPGGGTATAPNSIETAYLPTAIPREYVLQKNNVSCAGVHMEWIHADNKKDRIVFDQSLSSVTILANTEFAQIDSVVIHDHKGYLIKNYDIHTLYWDEYGYLFSLFVPADMPDEEALALAESLRPNENATKLAQ